MLTQETHNTASKQPKYDAGTAACSRWMPAHVADCTTGEEYGSLGGFTTFISSRNNPVLCPRRNYLSRMLVANTTLEKNPVKGSQGLPFLIYLVKHPGHWAPGRLPLLTAR